nr:hypothetical protein Itr_chr15CG09190 [Ipomoea trifida]GMD95038.1 hypothetical protein Iba_chr15aCG8410 [Ipomoea batatas]GMD97748.1 hypothetical protein Iba_chr15cCG5550 [Ipomoea batatas]
MAATPNIPGRRQWLPFQKDLLSVFLADAVDINYEVVIQNFLLMRMQIDAMARCT